MQNIWKTILDGLTYKDLAGKRQPRAFAVLSLIVLFLMTLVGGYIFLSRFRLMSQVEAEPIPVSISSEPEFEPTSIPPTITAYEPGCPTDSEQWSLTEPVIPQNYKIIQPACVKVWKRQLPGHWQFGMAMAGRRQPAHWALMKCPCNSLTR